MQLEWEAHVVEYVNFLWGRTKVHGGAGKEIAAPYLSKDIPLMGPQFVHPSYLQLERRQYAGGPSPATAYIKPINVVHPFYYPTLTRCPKCKSKDVLWEGWTGTGSREVHGLNREEMAIGYQLRCKSCENRVGSERAGYCYATTNPVFWQEYEHWQIPR
jgi:hypothetical protein